MTPNSIFSGLCGFLGIPYTREMVHSLHKADTMKDVNRYPHLKNVKKKITEENIGKGCRELSEKDIQKINKIIGSIMPIYGFQMILDSGKQHSHRNYI